MVMENQEVVMAKYFVKSVGTLIVRPMYLTLFVPGGIPYYNTPYRSSTIKYYTYNHRYNHTSSECHSVRVYQRPYIRETMHSALNL